jgi:hypothetical protein
MVNGMNLKEIMIAIDHFLQLFEIRHVEVANVEKNKIRGEITQSNAHRSHKHVNNAWNEISNSPPTLLFIPFPVPPH